jgi:hypothetical protein
MKGYKCYKRWFREYQWDLENRTYIKQRINNPGRYAEMEENFNRFLEISGWEIEKVESEDYFSGTTCNTYHLVKKGAAE